MATAKRKPGRPRMVEPGHTRERILDAATDLFSAHGFEGISLRDIAAVVKLDVATVHHHAGSKAALYEAVFQRMYTTESEAIRRAAAVAAGEPGTKGLHRLLDAFLDFLDTHPEVTYLWLRRWLEPAQHRRLDEEYSLPIYDLVEEQLSDDPHAHQAVRSVVWAVHGHVTACAALRGAALRREREVFRAFAHRMVDALWA